MPHSSPIIVAHRGLHTVAPENSIGAFIAAAQAKIPWVECDVWPSTDGVPIVIHDETVDRTTAGKGPVRNYSCTQLQQLTVPSLADVLSALSKRTAILVEIKPSNAAEFAATVQKILREYPSPWMLQSFHRENLLQGSAWLVEGAEKLHAAVESTWPMIHAEHSLIDRGIVDRLHAAARKIGAWTVNTPDDIQRMIDLGVDMLITDEPMLAAGIIANRLPSRF